MTFALLVAAVFTFQACDNGGTEPEPQDFTLTVALDGIGEGSVASEPAGIACDAAGTACSAAFEEGTAVTLTATAAEGSVFDGWTGDGSGAAARTVEMSSARSVTASFDDPDLAVQSVGSDGGEVVSRDGEVTLVFPAGALTGDEEITIERLDPAELGEAWSGVQDSGGIAWAYDFGPDGLEFAVPVELRATPQSYDPGTGDTLSVTIPNLATLEADSVASADSVGMEVDLGAGESRVAARIRHFSTFVWTEDFGDVAAGLYVREGPNPMTEFIPVGQETALGFTASSYDWVTVEIIDMTVEVTGPATYVWNETGNGFNIRCTGAGTASVRVTVELDLDGPRRTVGFLFAVDCIANDLTVTTSGQGSGTVTAPDAWGEPGGINCGSGGSDCAEEYAPGAGVVLTGTPDDGSFLYGWRVDGQFVADDGSGQLAVTLDADRAVEAVFEPVPDDELSLLLSGADGTVTSSPSGIDCTKSGETVTGSCAAPFAQGTEVELTATTPDGSIATDWSGAGTTTLAGTRLIQMAAAASVAMAFPNVPSAAAVFDFMAFGYYYIESITFASMLFPFLQAANDAPDLLADGIGEACPTVLLAAAGNVVAVDACDGSVVQSYDFSATFYNAWALPRPPGETGDHAIVATGQDYAFFWVDDTGAVVAQVGLPGWGTVPDATAIGGDPASGLAIVRDEGTGSTIRFVRFDPAKGYHDFLTDFVGVTHVPPGLQTVFASGVPADPAALPEEMLAVGATATNGVLYHIETVSAADPVHTEIGALSGDNPRRIRCDLESGICAVSDYANSLVNVILWSGTGTPTIAGATTAGAIAQGPVGLDVYGHYIVTAGYGDNQYSIIEVDAAGAVVSTTTTPLPAGCASPGHARFLRDGSNTVLVSCNGTHAMARIPNAF